MREMSIRTKSRTEMIDITSEVQDKVGRSDVVDGICTVFVPHTTAAVTINENADPSVRRDILAALNKLVPETDDYAHSEGNSDGHIKASLVGSSVQVFVRDGKLALGSWQGVYFCEFDGPRTRHVWVDVR